MANIDQNNIPQYWASLVGWTRSDPADPKGKKPSISPSNADSAYTLTDLLTLESPTFPIGNVGFINSAANDIVVIDIDADKTLKALLSSFLKMGDNQGFNEQFEEKVIEPLPILLKLWIQSSYCERSVSKAGLHLVLRTDKSKLPEGKAYIKAPDFDGQLSIKNNYMVVTGDTYSQIQDILTVDAEELNALFAPSESKSRSGTRTTAVDNARASAEIDTMETLPTMAEVTSALDSLPLDQCEKIRQVYKEKLGTQYEHYQYWLYIGMALHDFGQRTNANAACFSLFLNWSARDLVAFSGDKSVEEKWKSFSDAPITAQKTVTYKTIFKLAQGFELDYPVRKKNKDGHATKWPDPSQYENFKYLCDYYNMKLYTVDDSSIYVSGNTEILEKYFCTNRAKKLGNFYGPYSKESLAMCVYAWCQGTRQWGEAKHYAAHTRRWADEPRESVNMFAKWLDIPTEELPIDMRYYSADNTILRPEDRMSPEESTLDALMSCIKWDNSQGGAELYGQMFFKTIMNIIKLQCYPDIDFKENGGFFAFIGKEYTFKSTFISHLLPSKMSFAVRDFNTKIEGQKNERDFKAALARGVIIRTDEFDGLLNIYKNGSWIKNIITTNDCSHTKVYESEESNMARRAVMMGTSNERELAITESGARKQWYTLIESLDTVKQLKLDLHAVYCDAKRIFDDLMAKRTGPQDELPWAFRKEDIKEINESNKKYRATTNMDEVIRIYFNFDEDTEILSMDKLQEILKNVPNTGHYNITEYSDDKIFVPNYRESVIAMTSSENLRAMFMTKNQIFTYLQRRGINVNNDFKSVMHSIKRISQAYCPLNPGIIQVPGKKYKAKIEDGMIHLNQRASGKFDWHYYILPMPE